MNFKTIKQSCFIFCFRFTYIPRLWTCSEVPVSNQIIGCGFWHRLCEPAGIPLITGRIWLHGLRFRFPEKLTINIYSTITKVKKGIICSLLIFLFYLCSQRWYMNNCQRSRWIRLVNLYGQPVTEFWSWIFTSQLSGKIKNKIFTLN